jgi:putative DNA primase/helicase
MVELPQADRAKAVATITSWILISSPEHQGVLLELFGLQLPTAPHESRYTDTANGQRLAARYGGELKYVGPWGWLSWDGRRWRRDDLGQVERLAKDTAFAIYHEAADAAPNDLQAKAVATWAKASLMRSKLDAMLWAAQSEESIVTRSTDFDANKWLFNCLNGTIDLHTGKLKPHDRDDRITRLAPVDFDPAAKCELWLEFLATIFDDNGPLIAFFQKAVGYSLTGDTSEQSWFLLHGTGANGKSTAMQVLLKLTGEYGLQADPSAFLAKSHDTVSNDIARLHGARFVSAIEVGEGRRLAEVTVKQLTGGDTMTARFLYKESFEFNPELKLWLVGNHKPRITGTDNATWRRVLMIPFNVTIPPAKRDTELPNKLIAELPGILAWAVRGCLAWQKDRLQPPAIVTTATEAYRNEQDVIGGWLSECCIQEPNVWAPSKALLDSYHAYSDDTKLSARELGRRLAERGFVQELRRSGKGKAVARGWKGLRLSDMLDSAGEA